MQHGLIIYRKADALQASIPSDYDMKIYSLDSAAPPVNWISYLVFGFTIGLLVTDRPTAIHTSHDSNHTAQKQFLNL